MKLCRFVLSTILLCLALFSCAGNNGNIYPLDSAYLTDSTLRNHLTQLHREHPEQTSLHLIGFSQSEEIPIRALRIGSPQATRKVLVIGQHHGDEVLGVEVADQIGHDLLADTPQARAIREAFQVWIIPSINPEGWRLVRNGSYQWKRKNNFDSDQNGVFDLRDDGVDLNRNYPVYWELDKLTNPADPYYKGTEPGNQAEVQTVMRLAEEHNFELAIFYHSSSSGTYSEKIYLPAHSSMDEADELAIAEIRELAELYASFTKRDYRDGSYGVHDGRSSRVGNARNYFYHSFGTKAFLIEIGGVNRSGSSVVHPAATMMLRNRQQHSKAFLKLLYEML